MLRFFQDFGHVSFATFMFNLYILLLELIGLIVQLILQLTAQRISLRKR
jgi:hypothetical protein